MSFWYAGTKNLKMSKGILKLSSSATTSFSNKLEAGKAFFSRINKLELSSAKLSSLSLGWVELRLS